MGSGIYRFFVSAGVSGSEKEYVIDELGILCPTQKQVEELHAGEVGYFAAAIKAVVYGSNHVFYALGSIKYATFCGMIM